MTRAVITGRSPDARECPRCHRFVGGFFGGGRFQQSRHKTPEGKPCKPPRYAPAPHMDKWP